MRFMVMAAHLSLLVFVGLSYALRSLCDVALLRAEFPYKQIQ